MIKLLIVDDSVLMRRLLGRIFRNEGDFEVAYARDGTEALAQLHAFQPDVVTLDVNMPNMGGLECLDRIMIERPCPVVMVAAQTEAGAAVTLDAIELGAVDFFLKPNGRTPLAIEELAPRLVGTVREASRARLRKSLRLSERVRRQTGIAGTAEPPPAPSWRPVLPLTAPPRPARATAAVPGLVLVGCSTGGPPALDALLAPLPADFPWPVVVAQHMPAAFTGPLARRLDQLSPLAVQEVTEAVPLTPGHVYVARGDADIIVGARPDGLSIMAVPMEQRYRWHPSVDRLVTSALEHVGAARLVGVLMTGMGNDGATTMAALHAAGGRTIAESADSAVVWGMPGELARAGGADVVVPLEAIAPQLLAWLA